MRKVFLLTMRQFFFREIKTFISICHFLTAEFYIMNYFQGQLVFVCSHSCSLRFIYSGNETKTPLGPVDQLLFLRLQFEWFIISSGSGGIATTKNQYVASGPCVGFGCHLIDLVTEDPKTDLAFGGLYLRSKLLKSHCLKPCIFQIKDAHAQHKNSSLCKLRQCW